MKPRRIKSVCRLGIGMACCTHASGTPLCGTPPAHALCTPPAHALGPCAVGHTPPQGLAYSTASESASESVSGCLVQVARAGCVQDMPRPRLARDVSHVDGARRGRRMGRDVDGARRDVDGARRGRETWTSGSCPIKRGPAAHPACRIAIRVSTSPIGAAAGPCRTASTFVVRP
jgi:hypothetical protein